MAGFAAYRSLHSRAVVSVVALRFERAFAIGALVFRTREAHSAFVTRAAAFAASLHSRAFVCAVAGFTAFVAYRGLHSRALACVYDQVLCIACSIRIWRRRCGTIQNHSERKPCRKITSEIESES